MSNPICPYCGTVNPLKGKECLACGAPLSKQARSPTQDNKPSTSRPAATTFKPDPTADDLRKAGEKLDQVYNHATRAFFTLRRTLGEAIAIGIVAFVLGIIGQATGLAWAGILGGALVGLVVGLTTKLFWLTILGAPLGMLIGMVLWIPFWVLGAGPKGMVFTAAGLAIGGAILGKHKHYSKQSDWWARLRPLLGALGGLSFAGLGTLLAWGIGAAIQALAHP